jgi:predicted oxidoreductase
MRPLGKHGMQASAQGLGCMSLSKGFYHDEKSLGPEVDRMSVIREALSSGLTLLNTADAYGPYDNQILIGKLNMCNSLDIHSLAQQTQLVQQKISAPLKVFQFASMNCETANALCFASHVQLTFA